MPIRFLSGVVQARVAPVRRGSAEDARAAHRNEIQYVLLPSFGGIAAPEVVVLRSVSCAVPRFCSSNIR